MTNPQSFAHCASRTQGDQGWTRWNMDTVIYSKQALDTFSKALLELYIITLHFRWVHVAYRLNWSELFASVFRAQAFYAKIVWSRARQKAGGLKSKQSKCTRERAAWFRSKAGKATAWFQNQVKLSFIITGSGWLPVGLQSSPAAKKEDYNM